MVVQITQLLSIIWRN